MKIEGKKILLTGASGGIGSALAVELSRAGAHLVLCGRRADSLESLRARIAHPERHVCCCFDMAKVNQAFMLELMQPLGMVDMVINNAGVGEFGWLEDQSFENIEQQVKTNLMAPIMLTHSILPLMKKPGMIVNIGSCLGAIGYPGYSVYSATKFGLRGFSESLNRELSQENISVIYIAPRATSTHFNHNIVDQMNAALGNATDTPEQVARMVLSSIEAEKIITTIGWPEKLFVYINAIFPSVVNNAIAKKINMIKQYAKSKR